MSVFEYLGVLLSVVMGLGMTHVLIGISKMIHHRDTVRVYWVHLWWAVNVLVYVIAIWWGMFWWSSLNEWSFFNFLFVILYAIALFLLASLLFPWDLPEDFDPESHFYAHRRWFFGILFIAWCIDVPETVFKAQVGLRALPTAYLGWATVILVLAATAAWTDSKRFHAFYAVFWLVWVLGFLSLSTLNLIAS
jgi:hypothetical protein